MSKIIGYCVEDKYEIPIIKKDDNKYYRQYPKIENDNGGEEQFPKEIFQYAMTTPWDKMHFYHEEKDGQFIVNYLSPIYDWFNCRITGVGDTLDHAMLNLIENILDVMQGYNEEEVEKFMDNYNEN